MARKTRFQQKIDEDLRNENLPLDVLPYSNGEHFPEEPTRKQLEIMKIYDAEVERVRRAYGMSRRDFVRTAAAFTIGLWAMDKVTGGRYGRFAWAGESMPDVPDHVNWDACILNNPGSQLSKYDPGEFIFDVQTHHVTDDTKWRVLLPVHHAFICGFFGVAGQSDKFVSGPGEGQGGNVDPCDNVGRWQYLKDIYLDSSTTAGVLSPVPAAPDEQQPLPFIEADRTAALMESLTGTKRVVTHGYVMPNRGWVRSLNAGRVPYPVSGQWPAPVRPVTDGTGEMTPASPVYPFLQDELDWMEERSLKYGVYLRGWKVYTPYGDVPFSSGMGHDDDAGMAMNEKIVELWQNYGTPPVLASHKGIWLPTFDDRRQACDDVPAAAKAFPDIRFVIYHSAGGWTSAARGLAASYPVDDDSAIPKDNYLWGIYGLLKNLKEEGLDALSNILPGLEHGNSPNVYVDLGSVIPNDAEQLALFFGNMIRHLGARRICLGTDSIWGGSPQGDILKIRTLRMSELAKETFNLPHGMNGDRYDPRVRAWKDDDETDVVADYSHYSDSYAAQYLALDLPENGGPWPRDQVAHPERSIRNGILGWNAGEAYEHDPRQTFAAMECDRLNEVRDQYLGDRINGLASIGPSRSNIVYGPRTRQETIAMLNEDWKKNGWRA